LSKKTAEQIIASGNHYCLALKGNQLKLKKIAADLFRRIPVETYSQSERQRGRQEKRDCQVIDLMEVSLSPTEQSMVCSWEKLRSIVKVERWRTSKKESSHEISYYISNLCLPASEFARGIRGHWSIENRLHWIKDAFFKEDHLRLRNDTAAKNLSLLCSGVIAILYRSGNGTNFKERTRYYINRMDRIWETLGLPPPTLGN
jgi:predicted transposase YbfD/YdcC